jgi:hypothetical protein
MDNQMPLNGENLLLNRLALKNNFLKRHFIFCALAVSLKIRILYFTHAFSKSIKFYLLT